MRTYDVQYFVAVVCVINSGDSVVVVGRSRRRCRFVVARRGTAGNQRRRRAR